MENQKIKEQKTEGQKMDRAELVRRYLLFVVSLFFAALGIAFTRHGELGVSPVSSVANILSYRFPALSLGTWLIIWNCVLIVGQIVILRRDFQLIQLLQVPLSFLFGWFTDIGMWIVSPIPAERYPVRLLMVVIGTAVLGFGISLAVTANVILNSGEAFVKAVSDTAGKDFGNVKIAFDVTCVTLSIVLSMLFFRFRIVGTREGTIIAAFFTGVAVKYFAALVREPLNRLLVRRKIG